MTKAEELLFQKAGLLYDRIPPSITRTFPHPTPVFGVGNIMFRLSHEAPLVYTTSAGRPSGQYPISRPNQYAGFVDFAKGLPDYVKRRGGGL